MTGKYGVTVGIYCSALDESALRILARVAYSLAMKALILDAHQLI